MSKQVTMWGYTYDIVPAEEATNGLTQCGSCSLNPHSKHGKSLRKQKILPCLRHHHFTDDCEKGHFFKLIWEAKP